MKKNLLIFVHENLNKNSHEVLGIKFLKKKFNTKIFNVSKLFRHKIDKILKKNKNSICFEIGFNFKSFYIRKKIKENNSLLASVYTLGSYPHVYKSINLFERVKRKIKLFTVPNVFFYKFVDFILNKLKIFYYSDIVFYGGTESYKYPGFNKARYKIYASSLDYGLHLKNKNTIKKPYKRRYALFIDTYFPFHPDHKRDTNLFIKPAEYFRKLEFFFKEFERVTKLKIVIALHPRADIKKYPSYIKKFKIVKNKTINLIKYSNLVLHHGSTAQSYAVIYNKPLIFLTSNEMLKYEFVKDHTYAKDLFGSKLINIDNIDYKFLSNKNKLFYFNKNLYSNYIKKYLKHPRSPDVPWYISFKDFTSKKATLFS